MPLADTLKRAGPERRIAETTAERAGLWRAQTPQGFRFAEILAAHEAAAAAGPPGPHRRRRRGRTGRLAVTLVRGQRGQPQADDGGGPGHGRTARAQPRPDVRTGQGFDVHRFAPGDHVWLCGVAIPHTHALEGHSDADVGLHALTDALLGAIGDGDIGQHFPNTDPSWKGAPSHLFLAEAARRVRAHGGADRQRRCHHPVRGPQDRARIAQAMRARIAEILGIDPGRVAVKATTTEGLGFTGRREGIAALATATVVLR